MLHLPLKAEVHCSDGPAGRSTHVIGNPINNEITHLVVKSYLPPSHEYLVSVDQVEATTDDRITLKCTRDEIRKMQRFEYEEYIHTEIPGYLYGPYVVPGVEYTSEWVDTYIPVKRQNVPQGEFALHRGAR